jgi:glycosyltransferase involved in cell wall biosynthesis
MLNLVLFFTRGVSLQTWDQVGMFEREVALYRLLQERGVRVTFVTYGGAADLQYNSRIPGIRVLYNRWRLPHRLYGWLLPWLHGSSLREADVVKTNQTKGADIALRAAQRWHKPLVARCGYMWSANVIRQYGKTSAAAREAISVEAQVFRQANQVVVTTPLMAADIVQRIPESSKRTVVIPNYVETERFAPGDNVQRDYDVIYVGRISPEKNVESLLDAVEKLSIRISIIGEGEPRARLQEQYTNLGTRVSWLGKVPNKDLPAHLNRARIFVLPSHYEGHPKALIEAMACGLPVIGTNVPGIREMIRHGETGWLCGTDAASIRAALEHLLADPALCERLGHNARKFIVDNFSLERIVEMELQMLSMTLGQA